MFTGNQKAILRTLAELPERALSMSELGRMLGKPPGVFQRGLNALEDSGYIVSRRQANQRLISLNPAYSLECEIRKIADGAPVPLPPEVYQTFREHSEQKALQAAEPPGFYEASARKILIIAGPNGAGKTTFAHEFLPREAHCFTFINADHIARGLSPFSPETVAIKAGRLMLKEIDARIENRHSLALETTLSGRRYARLIPVWQEFGYAVKLIFLSLPCVEMAIARVKTRVRQGGHTIPEKVIRRRFEAGVENVETVYKPLVNAWALYDNSRQQPVLIEEAEK